MTLNGVMAIILRYFAAFGSFRGQLRTEAQNIIDSYINSATDLRGCVGTQVYQSQWNNAMQRPLLRSRSFKVTDFGTNRKLIYDYLLLINTNVPPILHRFQVIAGYWSNFR